MGLTYTIMTALWSFLYVYLINHISTFMKKPKIKNMIEGITGTILIGFGIKLFLKRLITNDSRRPLIFLIEGSFYS